MLVLGLAGCGGGGGAKPKVVPVVHVRFHGATFSAPPEWSITRTPTTASVSPAATSDELISVSVFRLLHLYRPALWPKVIPELDRAAVQLARQLGGVLDASRTGTVAGGRVRQYDFSFKRNGRSLKERITFVLRGRQEYELLCRWAADASEPAACASLVSTFRPA